MTAQAAACIPLRCRALASQRNLAIGRSYVSVGQAPTAIQVLGVIAGVTALAQHRDTHFQQRRHIRTVRRVTVGAVVRDRLMFPEEWTALLRMARGTRLVDGLLDEELGTIGPVRVVTARTADFSFQDRVPREAMNLGLLCLVARCTHVDLGDRVQHFLLDRMPFVAVGTGNAVRFVLAPRPVRSRQNVGFMTVETGCISRGYRRKILGFGAKHHLWRLAARIALVLGAFAMTALAARGALVTLHTMLGLVDGEDRLAPRLIVAHGALFIAFQGSVDLRQCGPRAEKYRKACTDQK